MLRKPPSGFNSFGAEITVLLAPALALGRHERNYFALVSPVNGEIIMIQSDHKAVRNLLAHSKDTSISKVHRLVSVLLHKAGNAIRPPVHIEIRH